MQNIKAVIFDLYGTLIDNYSVAQYRELCREVSEILAVDHEKFYDLWEPTYPRRACGREGDSAHYLREVCAALGKHPAEEAVSRAVAVRLAWAWRILSTRPHSPAALSRIRQAGYLLGLISDCSWELPLTWPLSPLAPFFDAVVFSCDEGTKKPDPHMFLTACDRLGVLPENCLYVGDGGSDELSAASELGMEAIQIEMPHELDIMTGGYPREDWPGKRIRHIDELLIYLDV